MPDDEPSEKFIATQDYRRFLASVLKPEFAADETLDMTAIEIARLVNAIKYAKGEDDAAAS